MPACTFFGHRNMWIQADDTLYSILVDLVENKSVDMFYVGNQGNFDYMVRRNLKRLKAAYPHINYAVVLAYMPKVHEFDYMDYSDTIYPEELENTPLKYAIVKLNRWMLDKADYVITYTVRSGGGAVQFKALAEKKGKCVIPLETYIT